MLAIYKREMRGYFTGVIGYVFLVLFLAVGGLAFCYTTLYSMSATVTSYYAIMLIFSAVVLPLLTMKAFSEERKIKTEQLLLTAPVSIPAMVFAKFLASYTVYAAALVFNSLYFLILLPYAELKTAILLGNILALLLIGAVFIAIGVFVSSLVENQLSAAVGTISIIFVLLAIGLVNALIPSSYWIRFVLDGISVFSRFQYFSNGIFDIAGLVYYISITALFLYLTMRVFDRRRYK